MGTLPTRRLSSVQPDEYKLETFVERIYSYFREKENMEIAWGAEAVDYHELVSLVENVQADYERFQRNDPDAAAAHGIAPLKSGILAALMAILDLGAGAYDEARADPGWKLRVENEHVPRAHAFLHLAHTIPDTLSQITSAPAASTQQSRRPQEPPAPARLPSQPSHPISSKAQQCGIPDETELFNQLLEASPEFGEVRSTGGGRKRPAEVPLSLPDSWTQQPSADSGALPDARMHHAVDGAGQPPKKLVRSLSPRDALCAGVGLLPPGEQEEASSARWGDYAGQKLSVRDLGGSVGDGQYDDQMPAQVTGVGAVGLSREDSGAGASTRELLPQGPSHDVVLQRPPFWADGSHGRSCWCLEWMDKGQYHRICIRSHGGPASVLLQYVSAGGTVLFPTQQTRCRG